MAAPFSAGEKWFHMKLLRLKVEPGVSNRSSESLMEGGLIRPKVLECRYWKLLSYRAEDASPGCGGKKQHRYGSDEDVI